MRDYEYEYCARTDYIRSVGEKSGAAGIVHGNSGGKDSALTGILCKAACDNTLGLIMPCGSQRNYILDANDAMAVARQFGIKTAVVDLTPVRKAELEAVGDKLELSDRVIINIAPRLRMTTLYAFAAAENRLVAGTGNRSEAYMGYFTKWGDGAHDFNPIADLTVTEIYKFITWLKAPEFLLKKAPSAGLFDGQTDEGEMGVTYKEIDRYLLTGKADKDLLAIMQKYHARSEHKRRPISTFENP